jgi:hypothetical protein
MDPRRRETRGAARRDAPIAANVTLRLHGARPLLLLSLPLARARSVSLPSPPLIPSSSLHRILLTPAGCRESHQTPRLSISLSLPSLPLPLVRACARAPSLSPSPLLSLPPTTCAKFECKSPIWQARGWPLDSWPSVTLRGWLDRSASSRESGYAPPLLSLSLSPSRWSWYTSNPKPSPQGQKPPFNPSSYRGTSLGAWVCETLCPKQSASGASHA